MGNLISGPIFATIGYFGVFGLASCCNVITLVYLIFFLKESLQSNRVDKGEVKATSRSFIQIVKISCMYILERVKTVIKKRDGYRRLFIFFGIFIYAFTIFVGVGTEGSTIIYYSKVR